MFEKKYQNSETLGKDTINNWIIPFLSVGKRGFKSRVFIIKIITRWRELVARASFFVVHRKTFIFAH